MTLLVRPTVHCDAIFIITGGLFIQPTLCVCVYSTWNFVHFVFNTLHQAIRLRTRVECVHRGSDSDQSGQASAASTAVRIRVRLTHPSSSTLRQFSFPRFHLPSNCQPLLSLQVLEVLHHLARYPPTPHPPPRAPCTSAARHWPANIWK